MTLNGPASTDNTREITVCGYCRRRVYRQRNGEWYHYHNGSTSCQPGHGTGRKAYPLQITVKRRDR